MLVEKRVAVVEHERIGGLVLQVTRQQRKAPLIREVVGNDDSRDHLVTDEPFKHTAPHQRRILVVRLAILLEHKHPFIGIRHLDVLQLIFRILSAEAAAVFGEGERGGGRRRRVDRRWLEGEGARALAGDGRGRGGAFLISR